MEIEYLDEGKYAICDGIRFVRDDSTGYYLSSARSGRRGIRLHRYVYESELGHIENGCHIHHRDGNKQNNDISNLVMLTASEHERLHGTMLTEEQRQARRDNLAINARPKASEWHCSEKGREWHREHYERMKDRLHVRRSFTCDNCGVEFVAGDTGSNRFCSRKCQAAFRRKSGVDDEQRRCRVCGMPFTANKYSKTKCCSKSCAGKMRWAGRNGREG